MCVLCACNDLFKMASTDPFISLFATFFMPLNTDWEFRVWTLSEVKFKTRFQVKFPE